MARRTADRPSHSHTVTQPHSHTATQPHTEGVREGVDSRRGIDAPALSHLDRRRNGGLPRVALGGRRDLRAEGGHGAHLEVGHGDGQEEERNPPLCAMPTQLYGATQLYDGALRPPSLRDPATRTSHQIMHHATSSQLHVLVGWAMTM
jgi:hypothetical protein